MSIVRSRTSMGSPGRTIILMIAVLAIIPVVSADVGYECVGDNSFHNWTIDGEVHNATEACKYGCISASGICVDEPVDNGYAMAAIICLLMIAGIIAYMAMNIDRDKHGAIQIFFIFISMAMQYGALGVVRVVLDLEGISAMDPLINTISMVYFYVILFLLFYIGVMTLVNFANFARDIINKRKVERAGGLDGL